MTNPDSIARLTDASHRALGGPNPEDATRAYKLELGDVYAFIVGWHHEMMEKADEVDYDTTGDDFAHQLLLGMFCVGAQYGTTLTDTSTQT